MAVFHICVTFMGEIKWDRILAAQGKSSWDLRLPQVYERMTTGDENARIYMQLFVMDNGSIWSFL